MAGGSSGDGAAALEPEVLDAVGVALVLERGEELLEGGDPLIEIATELEKHALEDEYFVEQIYTGDRDYVPVADREGPEKITARRQGGRSASGAGLRAGRSFE